VRIAAVRTQQGAEPLPPGAGIWTLLDSWPRVQVRLEGEAPNGPILTHKHKKLRFEEATSTVGPGWFELALGEYLADNRRTGRMVLRFSVPKLTLHVYIVPQKLVTADDFRAMCADIERALDRVVAWRSSDPFTGAEYASAGLAAGSLLAERLDAVEFELRHARDLLRRPLVDLALAEDHAADRSAEAGFMPENAMVSHWAIRRRAHLSEWLRSLDEESRTLLSDMADRPTAREKEFKRHAERLSQLRQRLEGLSGRVSSVIRPPDLHTSIPVGPLLQRDYRLRTLTRAFAPDVVLRPDEHASDLSRYPPLLLNELFEVWGAVWMLGLLNKLGFAGSPSIRGKERIRGICWRLTRGPDEVIWLHYEPNPKRVDATAAPPAHQRDTPAEVWQAQRLDLDSERPLYGTRPACSPDYALRIRSGDRDVLLVGDASLTDPDYQDGKKIKTVADYVQSIRWWHEGRSVHCEPMGGFLIVPGTGHQWAGLKPHRDAMDVSLLPLTPRETAEAERRFLRMLGRYVRPVGPPGEQG